MNPITLDNGYGATPIGRQFTASRAIDQATFEIIPRAGCQNCDARIGTPIPLVGGEFSCSLGLPKVKGESTPREASFRSVTGYLAKFTEAPDLSAQDEGSHVVLPCDAIRKLGPIAQSQLTEKK